MATDNIIHRYAWALNRLSKNSTESVEIKNNLDAFKHILEDKKEIFELFKHPAVPSVEKMELVERVAKEFKFCETAQSFIKLLISEGGIEQLKDIVDKYDVILRAVNREIKVKVQAPYAADKKMLIEIKEVLSKRFGCQIILEFSENKDLIGGFRVIAEGRVFDCSVKGELEQIEKILSA